jgi:hypothetical protein
MREEGIVLGICAYLGFLLRVLEELGAEISRDGAVHRLMELGLPVSKNALVGIP